MVSIESKPWTIGKKTRIEARVYLEYVSYFRLLPLRLTNFISLELITGKMITAFVSHFPMLTFLFSFLFKDILFQTFWVPVVTKECHLRGRSLLLNQVFCFKWALQIQKYALQVSRISIIENKQRIFQKSQVFWPQISYKDSKESFNIHRIIFI